MAMYHIDAAMTVNTEFQVNGTLVGSQYYYISCSAGHCKASAQLLLIWTCPHTAAAVVITIAAKI